MLMAVTDAPPWLRASYARSLREAGSAASPDQAEEFADRLLIRWADRRRHYHSLAHLQDMLQRADQLSGEARAPELVRLAIFYHGAVFEPEEVEEPGGAGSLAPELSEEAVAVPFAGNWEDIPASSRLARRELTALGLREGGVDRVVGLIACLENLLAPDADADAAVTVDSALGLLSVDPETYRDYVAKVRAENAAVPLPWFLRARISALEALLARPSLFLTPPAAAWEPAARDNAEAEIGRSRAQLRRLDPQQSP
jgi:predicted metal-dependent HD superfamily phosphohydrolase